MGAGTHSTTNMKYEVFKRIMTVSILLLRCGYRGCVNEEIRLMGVSLVNAETGRCPILTWRVFAGISKSTHVHLEVFENTSPRAKPCDLRISIYDVCCRDDHRENKRLETSLIRKKMYTRNSGKGIRRKYPTSSDIVTSASPQLLSIASS